MAQARPDMLKEISDGTAIGRVGQAAKEYQAYLDCWGMRRIVSAVDPIGQEAHPFLWDDGCHHSLVAVGDRNAMSRQPPELFFIRTHGLLVSISTQASKQVILNVLPFVDD